jgi:hypothetical protein
MKEKTAFIAVFSFTLIFKYDKIFLNLVEKSRLIREEK